MVCNHSRLRRQLPWLELFPNIIKRKHIQSLYTFDPVNEIKCVTVCVLHTRLEQSVTVTLTETTPENSDNDNYSISLVTFQFTVCRLDPAPLISSLCRIHTCTDLYDSNHELRMEQSQVESYKINIKADGAKLSLLTPYLKNSLILQQLTPYISYSQGFKDRFKTNPI